jgi:hypothetical protein
MKIYSIKIALRGVSPMVWRRLCIPGKTSIASLHHIIQTVYSWDNEYLHQFHIYGKDYGLSYAGGIGFSDDPYAVHIDDFGFDVGDKFTYEYNFFKHILVDIRIEKTYESCPSVKQKNNPYCIGGAGMPGVDKYAKIDIELKLLKLIAKQGKSIKTESLRELVEEIHLVLFSKKRVNLSLAELL